MPSRNHRRLNIAAPLLLLLGALALGAPAQASSAALHRRPVHRLAHPVRAVHPVPVAQPPAVPAPPPAPARPMDMPAKPAAVTLRGGQLTVVADNSDLGQVLRAIAGGSGMTITGFNSSSRVFGVYGPGAPRDVLTDLLSGSGYNFVMTGETPSGAPRELVLSAQSGVPFTPGAQPVNAAGPPPWQQPLGPGALAHVPPGELAAGQQTPQERMQQHLQQLRRLRQPFQQLQ